MGTHGVSGWWCAFHLRVKLCFGGILSRWWLRCPSLFACRLMVDASEERAGAHSEKMLHGFHVTKKYIQNSVKLDCCDENLIQLYMKHVKLHIFLCALQHSWRRARIQISAVAHRNEESAQLSFTIRERRRGVTRRWSQFWQAIFDDTHISGLSFFCVCGDSGQVQTAGSGCREDCAIFSWKFADPLTEVEKFCASWASIRTKSG